jgi:hypothetical protein
MGTVVDFRGGLQHGLSKYRTLNPSQTLPSSQSGKLMVGKYPCFSTNIHIQHGPMPDMQQGR